MICLQHALSEGYTDIFISGGLSGRLDHTIANLQLLLYAKRHGAVQVMIADKYNQVFLIEDTFLTLPKKEGFKLSLFSYSEVCEGVTISGVKYPLSNYTLTNHFPLGISNEFLEDAAYLGCRKGLLLVMLSCDAPT